MKFSYRISSTGGSSDKYGKCEICNKHASEVFQQSKSKVTSYGGNAHVGNTFGHEQCLFNVRQ